MVEFALILPLFLLLLLGTIQVGLWQLRIETLQHAAIEGAIAGASEPAPPKRCSTAIATAAAVLGRTPATIKCTEPGNLITLELTDPVMRVAPFLEVFPRLLTVDVTGRAQVRR